METSVIKKLRQILSKSYKYRDHNDQQFLLHNLINRIQLAQEQFSTKFHSLLASASKIEKFKRGTIIFKQYEKTDSLFIVLKGTIVCIQQKNPDNINQYKHSVVELQELRNSGVIQEKALLIEQQLNDECVVIKKYDHGDCINQIEFFKTLERPFYAVCQQDCELAVIDKSILDQQVEYDKQKYEKGYKNIEFLKTVNIFRNLENQDQIFKEMFFKSKQEDYQQDDIVYNVSYPADGFCIVKEGCFKISKEHEPVGIEKVENIEVKNKRVSRNGLFHRIENGFSQIVSKGQVFGLDDCFGNQVRTSQVVCESQKGSLLIVSKHFLVTRLLNDPLMKNSIRQEIQKQEKLQRDLQADYELKQKKSQVKLLKKIKFQIPKLDYQNKFQPNIKSYQSLKKRQNKNTFGNKTNIIKSNIMRNLNVNNRRLLNYLETQESYQQDLLESKLEKQNEINIRMTSKLRQYQDYLEKKEGKKGLDDREYKFKRLENLKTSNSVNRSGLLDLNKIVKTQYSEAKLEQEQIKKYQQTSMMNQEQISTSVNQYQKSVHQQEMKRGELLRQQSVEMNRQIQQNILYQQQKYSLKRLTTMS